MKRTPLVTEFAPQSADELTCYRLHILLPEIGSVEYRRAAVPNLASDTHALECCGIVATDPRFEPALRCYRIVNGIVPESPFRISG